MALVVAADPDPAVLGASTGREMPMLVALRD